MKKISCQRSGCGDAVFILALRFTPLDAQLTFPSTPRPLQQTAQCRLHVQNRRQRRHRSRRRARLRRRHETPDPRRPNEPDDQRRQVQDVRLRERHREFELLDGTGQGHDAGGCGEDPKYRDRQGAVSAAGEAYVISRRDEFCGKERMWLMVMSSSLLHARGGCHQVGHLKLLHQKPQGDFD